MTVAADAPPETWEQYRVELTAYCYRMLGSSADAEDAVQDTMVRAWRSFDRFEGRSSVRSWLYKIATNVCLTMLESRQRRATPMDFGEAASTDGPRPVPKPEIAWLEPIPDARVLPTTSDPAELAVAKESVRLAFVAALQHLPAKQRAVLILREVLQWKASEVAELLGTTVASVNSALQRARATLAEQEQAVPANGKALDGDLDADHQQLLDRYAEAFERYDVAALVNLLHEDAILNMPPYDIWLQGPEEIQKWWIGPGAPCRGSKLQPITANGMPGFAQWRPEPDGDGYYAWALQVLAIRGDRISGYTSFLDVETLFPMWGLPLRLDREGRPVTA
ncbi:MAG TPA: sigma-70 family RNA polymerase sigma factor [Pseudonocardia sp.]|jgi:RNA polymerase sigma-70 factor (ECF subfamily)|uniref:sigma-70 family RNA polymerase sigma factor n=1 Tax=Pseudonocardia sp. TaxID=60912 RepID=UPI002B4B2BAA|nr:sigma-70 family RNA polymerase sigma factor [Pseudonocardia sp.]HLU55488.1 sigma-70 family RNA polymerase sigma factor [Pseudonocardia sp.]